MNRREAFALAKERRELLNEKDRMIKSDSFGSLDKIDERLAEIKKHIGVMTNMGSAHFGQILWQCTRGHSLYSSTEPTICKVCFPAKKGATENKKFCRHTHINTIQWPDGGDVDVCLDCWMSRYVWEQGETEWEDKGWKSLEDAYKAGEELRKIMNEPQHTKSDAIDLDVPMSTSTSTSSAPEFDIFKLRELAEEIENLDQKCREDFLKAFDLEPDFMMFLGMEWESDFQPYKRLFPDQIYFTPWLPKDKPMMIVDPKVHSIGMMKPSGIMFNGGAK